MVSVVVSRAVNIVVGVLTSGSVFVYRLAGVLLTFRLFTDISR